MVSRRFNDGTDSSLKTHEYKHFCLHKTQIHPTCPAEVYTMKHLHSLQHLTLPPAAGFANQLKWNNVDHTPSPLHSVLRWSLNIEARLASVAWRNRTVNYRQRYPCQASLLYAQTIPIRSAWLFDSTKIHDLATQHITLSLSLTASAEKDSKTYFVEITSLGSCDSPQRFMLQLDSPRTTCYTFFVNIHNVLTT